MNTGWLRALLCTALALTVAMHAPNLGENPTLAKSAIERDHYGINKNQYVQQRYTVKPRETLASILRGHAVAPGAISRIEDHASPVFDVRTLQAGNELLVYSDTAAEGAPLLVYRPEPTRYIVFDFRDSVAVYEGFLKPSVARKEVRGSITQSLYETLDALQASSAVAAQLARIFAWQVDFYRLNKGDRFAVVYDEDRIDDMVTRIHILAARFQHDGQDFYAYGFPKDDGRIDYYDEEGKALRRTFLKAPLEYTRISSRFSRRRFHPVQKRYKPHLGTDFAAPHGTPIMATADGTVIATGYDKNNGRYVKVRHNDLYTTGYLHMSRIAVKRDQHVQQGEVIGYVGSTGLATGPHVCYRFWLNGRQVDPHQLVLPPAAPIDSADSVAFKAEVISITPRLAL